jgi:hypothetical protein
MIKYKVVTEYESEKGKRFSYPGTIKKVVYTKGQVIRDYTRLGFFLFNRRKDAEAHMKVLAKILSSHTYASLKIIRVDALERVKPIYFCPDPVSVEVMHENRKRWRRKGLTWSPRLTGKNVDIVGDSYKTISAWICAKGSVTCKNIKVID